MAGVTQKVAVAYERAIAGHLSACFGDPDPYGSMLEWLMPVHGGHISLHLVQDSLKQGRDHYRSRTLFCRFNGLGGRYGSSGKNNMHCPHEWSHVEAVNTTIWHVRQMTEPNSREREALDAIKLETPEYA